MLDVVNYPVSAILWFWHEVFGLVLDPDSGYAWALAVVFLVFSLRALLFKPFVHQVRSMRQMQRFAPQVRELQAKYGDDRVRMAQEMQKLQTEHGFNPVSGCLPMLVQIPVFIGLFQVLNGFRPGAESNFVFNSAEVTSFVNADLFGASLSSTILQPAEVLADFGTDRLSMLLVGIPLMVAAAVATHFTMRHSIARQSTDSNAGMQAAPGQAAVMNRLMLWILPAFAIIGGPFLPLAILLYWLANNIWTLAQQRIVFRRIDREEAERPAPERITDEGTGSEDSTPLVVDAPATDPASRAAGTAADEESPVAGSGADDVAGDAPADVEDRSRDEDLPEGSR